VTAENRPLGSNLSRYELIRPSTRDWKQSRIIYQDSFTTTKDFLAFRPTIHKAVLDFVQAVVLALRAPGLEQLLAERHQHLPEVILAAKSEEPLSSEMANAIEAIWRDPVVLRVLDEHQNGFYLMDNAL
jgi:guanine nucleotide-binding protein subunit alpha